jgi:hypothetical protein
MSNLKKTEENFEYTLFNSILPGFVGGGGGGGGSRI